MAIKVKGSTNSKLVKNNKTEKSIPLERFYLDEGVIVVAQHWGCALDDGAGSKELSYSVYDGNGRIVAHIVESDINRLGDQLRFSDTRHKSIFFYAPEDDEERKQMLEAAGLAYMDKYKKASLRAKAAYDKALEEEQAFADYLAAKKA